MKKYLLGLFAIVMAIGLNSFKLPQKASKSNLDTFYWYKVDYSSNSLGQISPNTPVEFSGAKIDQPTAQTGDECDDVDELHCLRGFREMPDLSVNPVLTYDASTPKPE